MDVLFIVVLALGATWVALILIIKAVAGRPPRTRKPRTPGGLEVADPTDEPEGSPPTEEKFEVEPLSGEKAAYACGHESWKDFRCNFWGLRFSPPEEELASREKCPECMLEIMRKASIRCALCGHVIFPGEPVACYGGGPGLNKKWAARTDDGGYLGCLRRDCCPSGGFFAGHWDGEKLVSPFGGRTAAEEAFATGKPVVVSDTGKKDLKK